MVQCKCTVRQRKEIICNTGSINLRSETPVPVNVLCVLCISIWMSLSAACFLEFNDSNALISKFLLFIIGCKSTECWSAKTATTLERSSGFLEGDDDISCPTGLCLISGVCSFLRFFPSHLRWGAGEGLGEEGMTFAGLAFHPGRVMTMLKLIYDQA